jgi:uncharacterized RDD family membrane protein YckC
MTTADQPQPPPAPPPSAVQTYGAPAGIPAGMELSSVGKRLGGYLLDLLLFVVTLGVGWIIWSLVVWARGQSPGKQILKMKCVKIKTGRRATWGTMALREFVGKYLVMSLISAATAGIGTIVLYFMLLWTQKRQELWDFIADTIVVDDPGGTI